MQYTVIIKKEHCLNTTYSDYKDCGLARAIRDQFPEFKLKSIGGSYVRDTDHNEWKFDMTCWANSQFESLLKGEIESVSVTLQIVIIVS